MRQPPSEAAPSEEADEEVKQNSRTAVGRASWRRRKRLSHLTTIVATEKFTRTEQVVVADAEKGTVYLSSNIITGALRVGPFVTPSSTSIQREEPSEACGPRALYTTSSSSPWYRERFNTPSRHIAGPDSTRKVGDFLWTYTLVVVPKTITLTL